MRYVITFSPPAKQHHLLDKHSLANLITLYRIFQERDSSDKTSFKRNEFSVGQRDKATVARSPIRRPENSRTTRTRSRTRERLFELVLEDRLPSLESESGSNSSAPPNHASNGGDTLISASLRRPTRTHERARARWQAMNRRDSHVTRSQANPIPSLEARRSAEQHITPERRFAPALHYYAENERSSSSIPLDSSLSPPSQIALDATRAFDRQLLEDIARIDSMDDNIDRGLNLDGASNNWNETSSAPRININRIDGLGDRRRSISQEGSSDDNEENWTSLFASIPPDHHLPSESSSFTSASASASSSLSSRGRPRSTTTTLTAPDTRSNSTDAIPSNCPEPSDREISPIFPRPANASSENSESALELTDEQLGDYVFASLVQDADEERLRHLRSVGSNNNNGNGEENAMDQREDVSERLRTAQRRLMLLERYARHRQLDTIMSRMENQQPVPEEMWISAGLTHLGLQRSERLLQR
jgi:hypothetical protein